MTQRNAVTAPGPLDIWSLYPAILDAINTIANSRLYDENGQSGVVIIQGRHVMCDTRLIEESNCDLWLDQDDIDICIIRYLTGKRKWDVPTDASAADIELAPRQKETQHDSNIWAAFEHPRLTKVQHQMNSSHIIDVGVKTAD